MYGDTIGTSQRRDFADTSDKRMTRVVTGAVTATYDPPRRTFSQDAFGNVLSGSSDGFHLTTKRHYSAIGLYYFYQRWYDPVLGRFSTKSPMPSFLEHPYAYCENNPTGLVDILGLDRCMIGSTGEVICVPENPPSEMDPELKCCLDNCETDLLDTLRSISDWSKRFWSNWQTYAMACFDTAAFGVPGLVGTPAFWGFCEVIGTCNTFLNYCACVLRCYGWGDMDVPPPESRPGVGLFQQ